MITIDGRPKGSIDIPRPGYAQTQTTHTININ